MATTVGQHSVAAFTSPVNGTTPIDANTVRGNDNTVRVAYVDHDADPGIHVQSSTLASRPAAGTAGRKWITEDSGVYTLWFDDGTNWHPVSSENVALTVLATENLAKGDVVKVTGWNNGQDLPEVAKVSSASDTAFAIITAAVTNGAMGYATNTGIVQDLATNSFSVGDILYPNSSGWFTATKPTSGNYQAAAYVLRSNANNGVLYVEFSAPRIVERSDNTASTIVLRDASGNFSAGTITAGALTSTGLVTFASLKGTGATTVTNILDEDNMASDSATALATQQSIKAYVDSKVATVDTLAEVLANGNTTGANDIIVNSGQKIRTPLVAAQDGTSAITIANSTGALTLASALADSNLATISTAGKVSNSATTATSSNTASAIVARDASGNFTAGTITATLNGAAPAGSLSGTTLASGVTASSLTSVGTLTSLTVSGATNVATASAATKIGLGTTSPDASFKVTVSGNSGTTSPGIYFDDQASSPKNYALYTNGSKNFVLRNQTDAINIFEATSAGNVAFDTNTLYVDAANNRVGVGTASPDSALVVQGGTGTYVQVKDGTVNTFVQARSADSVGVVGTLTNHGLAFWTNSQSRMTLDASGNLGLGVTPSAWSTFKVLQSGQTAYASNGITALFYGNGYYDGAEKYITTGTAARFDINNSNNNIFRWYTAASGTAGNAISFGDPKMTLDASGNLGVGETSPGARLTVKNSTSLLATFNSTNANAGYVQFQSNGSDFAYIGAAAAIASAGGATDLAVRSQNVLIFTAGGNTERARIDASGNLGVGTTSPATDVVLTVGGTDTNSGIMFDRSAGDNCAIHNVGGGIVFKNGSSTTVGGLTERARITPGGYFLMASEKVIGINTTDGSDNGYLALAGAGEDGTGRGGAIYLSGNERSVDAGTVVLQAGNVSTGLIAFRTGAGTERARITPGGYFKASNDGTYNNATGAYHELRGSESGDFIARCANTASTNPYGFVIKFTAASPNDGTRAFLVCEDSTANRALILSNGGLANYSANNVNLASDERLKKDIAPLTSTWDKLKAIEVVNFRYKDCNDGDPALYGVIAQQVQPIVPELVIVTREAVEAKDAVLDEDGNEVKPAVEAAPEYYGIREQPMYWLAIKALQEAMARIEALEARLEALEA